MYRFRVEFSVLTGCVVDNIEKATHVQSASSERAAKLER